MCYWRLDEQCVETTKIGIAERTTKALTIAGLEAQRGTVEDRYRFSETLYLPFWHASRLAEAPHQARRGELQGAAHSRPSERRAAEKGEPVLRYQGISIVAKKRRNYHILHYVAVGYLQRYSHPSFSWTLVVAPVYTQQNKCREREMTRLLRIRGIVSVYKLWTKSNNTVEKQSHCRRCSGFQEMSELQA